MSEAAEELTKSLEERDAPWQIVLENAKKSGYPQEVIESLEAQARKAKEKALYLYKKAEKLVEDTLSYAGGYAGLRLCINWELAKDSVERREEKEASIQVEKITEIILDLLGTDLSTKRKGEIGNRTTVTIATGVPGVYIEKEYPKDNPEDVHITLYYEGKKG